MDRRSDAVDIGFPCRDPGLDRFCPRSAVASHRSRKPTFGVTDRIERAVERQPVEIVRHSDLPRRPRDAVELEERFRREIGGGDIRDLLPGALGDQYDVGRCGERRQAREPAREFRRYTGSCKFPGSFVKRGLRLRLERSVERSRHISDAVAIVRDDTGKPLGEIDVAQEPDHAVA